MADNTYRYLSVLLAQGSFSKAAKMLDISQPSLSQFVLRLETETGLELIDRSVKPLRLTAAGECFMATERKIAQLREVRTKELADMDLGVRGQVRIGSSHYRSSYFLPEVLPIFRREHPGIDLTLVEATTATLEDYAADGTTDFSIVIAPLMSPDLAGDTIYEEKLLLATSATSELAHKVPSGPREFDSVDFALLDNEPFITIKRGQKFHLLFQDLCRRCSIAPRIVLESESPTAALMLTSAGIGSCFVTETLARRCPTPQPVRFFEIRPLVPPRQVIAAYRKNTYLSRPARALIDVMIQVGRHSFVHG